jgi:hypothetical protein
MERALYFDLDLHVTLAPPGHTDFGWWTTFAHCPRCKAGAPVEPWKKVRSAWLTCGMCGHEFDPATTASCETMPADDDEDLRAQMGEDRYRDFAIRYLTAIGRAPEFAQATVIKYLTPDPEQEERQRQAEERQRQKGEFIREVLCAGFKTLRPDVDDPASALSFDYLLTSEEVDILLERCRQWGAQVYSISHQSQSEEWDELYVGCPDFESPEAAFQNLRSQGCHELFTVMVGVSDEVHENWRGQHPEKGA